MMVIGSSFAVLPMTALMAPSFVSAVHISGTIAWESWLTSPLAGKHGGIPLTPLGSGFLVSQTRMKANNSFKPKPHRGSA